MARGGVSPGAGSPVPGAAGALPIRSGKEGIRIDVEVKVRSSRSLVLGVKSERLSVSLAAAPVDGAANEALRRLLAEHFGLPRSQVLVVAGEKSRRKVVELRGISPEQVLARTSAAAERA